MESHVRRKLCEQQERERLADAESLRLLEAATLASSKEKEKEKRLDRESLEILIRYSKREELRKCSRGASLEWNAHLTKQRVTSRDYAPWAGSYCPQQTRAEFPVEQSCLEGESHILFDEVVEASRPAQAAVGQAPRNHLRRKLAVAGWSKSSIEAATMQADQEERIRSLFEYFNTLDQIDAEAEKESSDMHRLEPNTPQTTDRSGTRAHLGDGIGDILRSIEVVDTLQKTRIRERSTGPWSKPFSKETTPDMKIQAVVKELDDCKSTADTHDDCWELV